MLREALYWLTTIVTLLIKCSYFQHTSQFLDEPFPSATGIVVMIMALSLLAIAMTLIFLIFKEKRFIVIYILNILVTVILIADTNFFRYYQGVITLPVILNLDLRLVGTVNESIFSVFQLSDIIYMIDLPLLFIWMIKLKREGVEVIDFRRRLSIAALALTISTVGVLGIHKNINVGAIPYSNNYITQQFGVLYTHLSNTKGYFEQQIFNDEMLTSDEKSLINDFYSSKNNVPGKRVKPEYWGVAKDKNLIMVQVEALQEFVVGRKVEGREITPNINKLMAESLYFDNIYCQTAAGNTSDAEFLTNASLYPAPEGVVNYLYTENNYYTLASQLKKKGYNTYAMHAFIPEFYDRNIVYKNYGYDKFFSQSDYKLDDFVGWETDALSDSSFFQQSIKKMEGKNPFYSFMVTLSSHHPFTYFEDYSFENDDFTVGKWEGTFLGNYLKAVHYADTCIGEFISGLKETGLYDNSVIVLYGDHTAIPRYEADDLMDFLQLGKDEFNLTKVKKVPFIIHAKDLGNNTISKTGGQIDIMPTISNLLGVKMPYAMGKNMLDSQEKGYAIFRNGSVITDNYLYLSDLGRMYDNEGNDLELSHNVEELNKFQQELHISDIIIENNAFILEK